MNRLMMFLFFMLSVYGNPLPAMGQQKITVTRPVVPGAVKHRFLRPEAIEKAKFNKVNIFDAQASQAPVIRAGRHEGLKRNLLASLVGSAVCSYLSTLVTGSRRAHVIVGALSGAASTIPVQRRTGRLPQRFILLGLVVGSGVGLGISEIVVSDPFIGVSFTPPPPPPPP